jgi:hypothetical protein
MDAEPLYTEVRSDLAAPLEARLARTTSSPDALHVLMDFLRPSAAHPDAACR